MNELVIKDENIESMIYEIRGKQVMLDSDLAKLYQCKNGTKEINQAVKNNPDKFPERFSWILDERDISDLRSKVLTANISSMSRSFPRVFTEQGVAMLATILKSKIATNVSIKIMDAFVLMRRYISSNLIEQRYINNLVLEDHNKIKVLEESFKKIEEKKKINEIYYEGQIYDAYSKIMDILSIAKKEVIIVDAYADKSVLDIIRKLNTKVVLICKTNGLIKKIDIEKYNKQYGNLKVVYNDSFHDRYFIIDKTQVYHCGTSINYAGSKTFSINYLTDKLVIDSLVSEVNKIL